MRSTGTTYRQLGFWEKELVEDLFTEGKSLLDRSTESSEFDRLAGKGMRSTGTTHDPQAAGFLGDLITEGKSLLDRSRESSEFGRPLTSFGLSDNSSQYVQKCHF